jgi:Fe-S cluster biosynthesis and repair protein YggX
MTGTGKFMKLWGYRSTQKCPRCGHHCETAAHITMCTAPSAIEQWKILLETLGKDLAKRHTHPGLTRFLLSRLMEWKTRTPRKALRPMEHDLQELQDAQDEIGWDKFMFGNISVLWQEIQAQYFREIGKQNSGLRWTSALSQKIWQVAWDQWEHRNTILHNSENLVTQAEAVMIASRVQMELETGIQGLLQGDRYLFDDHRVAKSTKWTVYSQVSWLDTVAEAKQAYTVSLTRLRGIFEGRS